MPGLHISLPIIAASYLGAATGVRDLALRKVAGTPEPRAAVAHLAGLLTHEVRAGWWAMQGIAARTTDDSLGTTAQMVTTMLGKRQIVLSSIRAAELAMELLGSQSYMNDAVFERVLRDVHAGVTHPLPPENTLLEVGRVPRSPKRPRLRLRRMPTPTPTPTPVAELSRRRRRGPSTRRACGRRRSGPPAARTAVTSPPSSERGRGVERGDQLAQLARRREVLVLVGDAHDLDAVTRREPGDHRLDELLGRARAGGDADDAAPRIASASISSGPSTRKHDRAAGVAARPSSSAIVFDEFALPITTTASARCAMSVERVLAVGGREAEVVAGRGPHVGEAFPGALDDARPIRSARASSARAPRPRLGSTTVAAAASRSASRSTSWIDSGATASVPTASSWPAWPT